MSKDKESAAPAVDQNTLNSNEIARAVMGSGVRPDGFRVEFNNGTATIHGTVGSEDDRQKILSTVRGTGGVVAVTDSLEVGAAAGATGGSTATAARGGRSYTVKSGDTLSKIAKAQYGDAAKYPRIFEANRNILSDPDKIQPGQVLAIPE